MKIYEHNGHAERQILTGMVLDDAVLSRIASRWSELGLFASREANTLGRLCVDYHRRYGKAPQKTVEGLFRSWAESYPDPTSVKAAESLLESLSRESEQGEPTSTKFLIDLAGSHFQEVLLDRLADGIKSDLSAKRTADAKQRVDSFRHIDLGSGAGQDLMTDPAILEELFAKGRESLFTYPGDLGAFFGPVLARDKFLSFAGPEKSGKSWWLMDVAYRAVLARQRVAFFEAGDDEQECKLRFCVRAARHPDYSSNGRWPLKVKVPRSIDVDKEGDVVIGYDSPELFDKPLDRLKAEAAFKRVMLKEVKSKKSWLKVFPYPTKTLTVPTIQAALEAEALNGWAPSVVVIDYADILAPVGGERKGDYRHGVEDTWARMRALSTSLDVLVVTATQTNRDSYDRKLIDRRDMAEDKRKLAFVSGMIGINVNPKEKEKGACRLNWVVRRKGAYSNRSVVYVAGCLALAEPAVLSCWPRRPGVKKT